MTTSEFIKIKKGGYKIKFNKIFELKKVNQSDLLMDFIWQSHQNAPKTINDGYVFVNAGKFGFTYQMYETGILKTNIENHNRTFYPII